MGNRKKQPAMAGLIAKYEEMAADGRVRLSDLSAYRRLLDYYARQEMYERVLEVAEFAKEEFPHRLEWHVAACEALVHLGLPDEAIAEAETAFAMGMHDAELCRQVVWAHIELEQHEEALAVIEQQKKFAPHPHHMAALYFLEGLVWYRLGEYAPAIEAFRNSLLLHPRHEEACKYFWLTSELTRTQDLAIGFFELVLEQDPYAARIWYCLANLCVGVGRYDKALEAYDFALVCNDRIEEAYIEYAGLLAQMGKHHQALRIYQDYIDRFGTSTDVLLGIARSYHALGHLSAARRFLEEAIQAEPQEASDELYFLLGECYAAEGFWYKARTCYLEALQLNDRHEGYAMGMAEACFHLGQLEEAKAWYEAAIEMAPEDTNCWLRYATFLLETRQAPKALALIEEAELNTCGTALAYGRVACLFALDRRDEAKYLLHEALAQDYSLHPVLFDIWPAIQQDAEMMQVIYAFQALPDH